MTEAEDELGRKVRTMVDTFRSIAASHSAFMADVDFLSLLAEKFPAVREAMKPAAETVAALRHELLIGVATLKRLGDAIETTDPKGLSQCLNA